MIRHKLYLQIYFAFIGGLLLFALLAALAWKTLSEGDEPARFRAGMALLLAEALPADQPPAVLEARLKELAAAIEVDLSIYSRDGLHLASSRAVLPLPKERHNKGWDHDHDFNHFTLRLQDGRWLVVTHPDSHFPTPLFGIVLMLAILAIVAFPIARRLTCRLEQLQIQVDEFGRGNLKARAEIRGKDEIALLAERFNHTAGQIEQLIEAQKHILSGASHELRSPLTRMRMAIELMQAASLDTTKVRLEAYITELDDLVDELLMASRLDAGSAVKPFQPIDLLALAAETAAPYNAEVSGKPVTIMGDETMLRRLLHNLLENGSRYAKTKAITVTIDANEHQAYIRVCDDGPGIAASEREKVFEPFYQARSQTGKHGSIGLGLSLVRKIARQHQGDVRYLEQEYGACFEVKIALSNTLE